MEQRTEKDVGVGIQSNPSVDLDLGPCEMAAAVSGFLPVQNVLALVGFGLDNDLVAGVPQEQEAFVEVVPC